MRDFKAYFRRRVLQTALAQASSGDGAGVEGNQTNNLNKPVSEVDAMFWIQVSFKSLNG